MKIRMMFMLVFVMALTPAVFATTINLFAPVAITASDSQFPPNGPWIFADAIPYGTKTVFLTCDASATAYVTGANGGGFVVDNFLRVNGTNVCGGSNSCFGGVFTDPLPLIGSPVEDAYDPTGPQVIAVTPGTKPYKFELMDYGYTLGNSEVNLVTSCIQGIPVCHVDNGKKGDKTIYVDSLAAQNAHLTNMPEIKPESALTVINFCSRTFFVSEKKRLSEKGRPLFHAF